MTNWNRFVPADFEYDFENDELAAHHVSFNEAVECFFLDFEVRRNKSYRDRFQLIGKTIGGRERRRDLRYPSRRPGADLCHAVTWNGS